MYAQIIMLVFDMTSGRNQPLLLDFDILTAPESHQGAYQSRTAYERRSPREHYSGPPALLCCDRPGFSCIMACRRSFFFVKPVYFFGKNRLS